MHHSPSLLASYFTLAGDVNPFAPPLISPVDFRVRAEAAGAAGFTGFGFAADDIEATLQTMPYAEMRRILAGNGLADIEIELLHGWFDVGEKREATAARRRFILDAAAALGARHVKLAASGETCARDHMIASFAAVCDEAAQAGTAAVIEISGVGRMPDLHGAAELVEQAGRSNGGLLLDIWHVTRLGIGFSDIARLPAGVLRHVELCDGPLAPDGDYLDETVNRRRLCGAGAFDIAGFLGAVAAAGYRGPYGIEILSRENRALAPSEAAAMAAGTARTQIDAAKIAA